MSKKELFLETVKNKLDSYRADVESLQAKAEQLDSKDMIHYSATIQEIIAKIQLIEKQFTDSTDNKDSKSDTWYALIKRTETSFEDVEKLLEEAKKLYSS